MYFPTLNQIITSWRGEPTFHAVKEAEEVAFYIENQEGILSRHSIQDVRGWVPPQQILPVQTHNFYQKLKPIFLAEQAMIILTLFIKKVHRIEYKKPTHGALQIHYFEVGEAVGFLENRECRILFLPQKGDPFLPLIKEIDPPSFRDIRFSTCREWKEQLKSDKWILKNGALGWLGFQLFVKDLNGKTITIEDNSPQHRVLLLKEKIEEKTQIPAYAQRLVFAGGSLDNSRTLSDYNIKEGSTFHLLLKLLGGGPPTLSFNSMEEEESYDLVPASDSPLWTHIRAGLNLQGHCKNPECEANGQIIWIQKGFGTFNMNKECEISSCPQCREIATDVNNCGFTCCIYSIKGETECGEKREKLACKAPDNKFLTFSASEDSAFKWRTLTITTVSLTSQEASIFPNHTPPSKRDTNRSCTLF